MDFSSEFESREDNEQDFFDNPNNDISFEEEGEKITFSKPAQKPIKASTPVKAKPSGGGVSNTLSMQPKKGALNLGKKKVGAKKLGKKIDFDELEKKAIEEQEMLEARSKESVTDRLAKMFESMGD